MRFLLPLPFIFNFCCSFQCPPATQIEPCRCWFLPVPKVRCDDVSGGLDTVRSILEEPFKQQPELRLHLSGIDAFRLPPRALGELKLKKFYLSDSNIRHIDDDTFDGQQASLTLLTLAYDRLQEIPAAALLRLSRLQSLGLAGNFLMRIREDSLPGTTHFLVLTNNRISGIEQGSFPRGLKILSLSKNLLTTFNGSLNHLEQLEELSASDNRLTSVKGELDGLVRLERLYLDRNYLSDISDSFSSYLCSLTSLGLSGNRIHKVDRAFAGLAELRVLDLSCNHISDLQWKAFETLKNLEDLDLSGNYVKVICPALRPLRSLRNLMISNLNLKTLDPDCFRNAKSLTTLDLSRNGLQDADAVFRHPLLLLRDLRLDHNRLNSLEFDFGFAKNIRHLDISSNNLSSFENVLVYNNKRLTTINLAGNPWKCTDPFLLMLQDMEEQGIVMQGRPSC